MTRCEVELRIVEPNSTEYAQVTVNNQQPACRPDHVIIPEMINKEQIYATCEKDHWKLDGSQNLFSGGGQIYHWWTTVQSGSDGVFTAQPQLTVSLGKTIDSVGLMLYFDPPTGDYCNDLYITWYYYDTVVKSGRYYPDNPVYFVDESVKQFNKVVMSFRAMNKPYRFLKLRNLVFGAVMTFADDNLRNAVTYQEISPFSEVLPIGTLECEVYSDDDRFSIYNPEGVYAALQQRQPMIVKRFIDDFQLPDLNYYLESWESFTNKTAKFKAVDIVGLLDKEPYYGCMLETGINAVVQMQRALEDYTMPDGVSVRSSSPARDVQGWIGKGTYREAIQKIAFGYRGYIDASQDLALSQIGTVAMSVLDADRVFSPLEIKLAGEVNAVTMKATTYHPPGAEILDLWKGVMPRNYFIVEFSDAPVWSVNQPPFNGVFWEFNRWKYANYIEANSGDDWGEELTVQGTPYEKRTSTTWATLPARTKSPSTVELPNVTVISDQTTMANAILSWYQKRYICKVRFVLGQERIGDCVVIDNDGIQIKGIITKMTLDCTGGMIADTEIVGEVI